MQNDAGDRLYYENNKPVTGWKQIGDKWYSFNIDGVMTTDTEIDGFKIGPDGVRQAKGSSKGGRGPSVQLGPRPLYTSCCAMLPVLAAIPVCNQLVNRFFKHLDQKNDAFDPRTMALPEQGAVTLEGALQYWVTPPYEAAAVEVLE